MEYNLELQIIIHYLKQLLYLPFNKKKQLVSLILTFSFLDLNYRNQTPTTKDLNRLTISQKTFPTTNLYSKLTLTKWKIEIIQFIKMSVAVIHYMIIRSILTYSILKMQVLTSFVKAMWWDMTTKKYLQG